MRLKTEVLETGIDLLLALTMIFSLLMILNFFGLATWPINYFGFCG